MILSSLAALCAILLLAVTFLLTGCAILERTSSHFPTLPPPLQVGAGYFYGAAFSLVVFKVANSMVAEHAQGLLIGMLFMQWSFLIVNRRRLAVFRTTLTDFLTTSQGRWLMAAGLGLCITSPLIWLFPIHYEIPSTDFVTSHIGSNHAALYGNLAMAMDRLNWIPVISLHLTQSMLGAMVMYLGPKPIYLILALWLSCNLWFLLLGIVGLFRLFGLAGPMLGLAVFIAFLGQPTLSLLPIQTTEGSLPLFGIGYSDSVLAIGTVLLMFLWLRELREGDTGQFSAITFLLPLFWMFTAEHVVVVMLPVLVLFIMRLMFRRTLSPAAGTAHLLAMASAIFIGMFQGGLLVFPNAVDHNAYFPLSEIKPAAAYPLTWEPQIPFLVGGTFTERTTWHIFQTDPQASYSNKKTHLKLWLSGRIWSFEKTFWESLRIVFFPGLGLLLLAAALHRNRNRNMEQKQLRDGQTLLFLAGTVFTIGYLIAFFVVFYNKFNVSRFLIIGYVLGMISLGIGMYLWTRTWSKPSALLLVGMIAVLSSFGPVTNYSTSSRIWTVIQSGALEILLTPPPDFAGAKLQRTLMRTNSLQTP